MSVEVVHVGLSSGIVGVAAWVLNAFLRWQQPQRSLRIHRHSALLDQLLSQRGLRLISSLVHRTHSEEQDEEWSHIKPAQPDAGGAGD